MQTRSETKLAIALAAVLLLAAGVITAMWRIGLLSFTDSENGSKVVAAALALVGTFAAAAVTMVGLVLKHAIDEQTLRQHEAESDRAEATRRDAERRLGLEAAVKALQLLSTSTGAPTSQSQRDGALFMLATFDQHELALQLASDLLAKSELSPGTACIIMDRALVRGDENARNSAIGVLHSHAARMATGTEICMPDSIMSWGPGLPAYVREWATNAIAELMVSQPVAVWTGALKYECNALVSALAIGWSEETDASLKVFQGSVLHRVLAAVPSVTGHLRHPRQRIDVAAIRNAVSDAKYATDCHGSLIPRLSEWATAVKRQEPDGAPPAKPSKKPAPAAKKPASHAKKQASP